MDQATTLDNRCAVLGGLWLFFKDTENETWSEFFEWADLGLPLAYMRWQELVELKPEAINLIDETWLVFCEMIDIDPEGEYANLSDAFDASPNALVED